MTTIQGYFSANPSLAPLAAGFSGGVVSTTALLPLDVIKVRLQVNETSRPKEGTKKRRRYRLGSLRVARSIIHHEGILGLYQGLVPAVMGSAISWGGYFYLYEGFKSAMRKVKAQNNNTGSGPVVLTSGEHFGLACSAGACMVALTNPIWLVKTRMQLQMKSSSQNYNVKPPYKNSVDAVRTIIAEEGIWALYKGAGPALLLTSHGGVQFVVYEFLKHHFHYARAKRDQSSPIMERLEHSMGFLTIGAISKITASTITYPMQVLKSRMQQRSESLEITESGDIRAVRRSYSGIVRSVVRIWRQEGTNGFFKGCIPNALRVAPGAAITFVVYESVMDYLE